MFLLLSQAETAEEKDERCCIRCEKVGLFLH
jgi:hypothetical protein